MSIKTLKELIFRLDECVSTSVLRTENVSDILSSYTGQDWRRFYWNRITDAYTRTELKKTKDYQILLLCWNKGIKSTIHDHGESSGVEKVLDGTLIENRYKLQKSSLNPNLDLKLKVLDKNTYYRGDVMNIDEGDIHMMETLNVSSAVSLHIYIPPSQMVFTYEPVDDHNDLDIIHVYQNKIKSMSHRIIDKNEI
jgi:cysteine dioxygenase